MLRHSLQIREGSDPPGRDRGLDMSGLLKPKQRKPQDIFAAEDDESIDKAEACSHA